MEATTIDRDLLSAWNWKYVSQTNLSDNSNTTTEESDTGDCQVDESYCLSNHHSIRNIGKFLDTFRYAERKIEKDVNLFLHVSSGCDWHR